MRTSGSANSAGGVDNVRGGYWGLVSDERVFEFGALA
jgi:hypothetical protein